MVWFDPVYPPTKTPLIPSPRPFRLLLDCDKSPKSVELLALANVKKQILLV